MRSEFYLLYHNTCLKGSVEQIEHRCCMCVSMKERKRTMLIPDVGGTTELAMPFRVAWVARAAMGLM